MSILNCIHAPVVELVDTPDLGSGANAWGFESLQAHQKTDFIMKSVFFLFRPILKKPVEIPSHVCYYINIKLVSINI